MKTSQLCSLALAALLSVNLPASAQFFTPGTAFNTVYPTGSSGALLRPETSSAYSLENTMSPWGSASLYMSGWSGGTTANGFAWTFTDPSNPSIVYGQGTVNYANARDIEVGYVDGPGPQILVARYENGVGHLLDVYNVLPSVSYSYTVVLSSSPVYGRISMDCHLTYGVALVWENPSTGNIEAMAGQNGTWGPVTALPPHWSGAYSSNPDVAFSHSTGPLNIHFVTYTPGANEMTESVVGWPDLLSGSLSSYVVEDNNPVGPQMVNSVRPVINSPDHYWAENWAYTYTMDDDRIELRFMDYGSSTFPQTRIVNSGVYGNVPTIGTYRNKMPSVAHYQNGEIYVAWYATDGGASNQYIALRTTPDANAMISAPDYMELPASATPFTYPLTPGISLSKMNDPNPQFLYAAYYDLGSGYQMHNAWHTWPNIVFKGSSSTSAWQTYHPECGSNTMGNLVSRVNMRVGPNPFTSEIRVALTADKSGVAHMQLTDVTGRIVHDQDFNVEKGTQAITAGKLSNLAAGTYLVTLTMNGERLGQQKIVKQ